MMRVARLSRLVVMFRCLDDSKSCSGVGPGSRFVSDDASKYGLPSIGNRGCS